MTCQAFETVQSCDYSAFDTCRQTRHLRFAHTSFAMSGEIPWASDHGSSPPDGASNCRPCSDRLDDQPTQRGTLSEQTRQFLQNLFSIVEEAGGSRETIVKVNLYVTDIESWAQANDIYQEMFAGHKPARSVFHVQSIRKGYDISLDATAVRLQ